MEKEYFLSRGETIYKIIINKIKKTSRKENK